MDNDSWVEDFYQRWLYDQDLIDKANEILQAISNEEKDDVCQN